ncbi:HalX domain-containing protein, partial [Halorubrum sp. SP9]|uniref:HalX domain-containing protein n=2 Tax=Halorubrum TaxID=56688 RepID=UPI00113B7ABF
GHEVLDAIRAEGYDVQVAMLTAVEPKDDITDMAFDAYRRKPINQDELRSLVAVLCHRATLEKGSQEFFRLAAKKAALEAAGNTEADAYETILDQLDALDAELTNTLEHLTAEDAFAAIAED